MKLFGEFPPVSTEAWMEVVERDLKGADFEKRLVTRTLDGLKLKPFYRKEDLPGVWADAVPNASGSRWILREEIREPDIAEANRHILRCLERGAEEVSIITYPIGPEIRTQADMQKLLEGVWIDAVPVHWLAGPLAIPTLALLINEARFRGIAPSELQGSIDLDPILDRCAGWTDAPIESWKEDFSRTIRYLMGEMPRFKLLTIRGALIEKAGASLAQELAFSLSLLAEYLHEAGQQFDAGVLGDGSTREAFLTELVERSEIRFGVGTNYVLEIAKLRAARTLLRNLLEPFGVVGAAPTIHAITTSSNKTLYDPYNNLLRATIESMAATIGGADVLSVAAYDQGYHAPDEISEHLSRNTQTLLRDEAYLGQVADPLGGSYTVEAITASLAQAAWDLFLKIESKGGFVAAWQEGFIGSELGRVREERQRQVSRRQRKIVGTTVYSNMAEQRIQDVRPRTSSYQVNHEKLWEIDELLTYFSSGADVGNLCSDHRVPSTALDPFRASWPFEDLRIRIERFVATGHHRPKVLLAMWGDKKMRRARSGFCQSFFAAGGYEVKQQIVDSPAEIATLAQSERVDLVVLCTSDDQVLEMAEAYSGLIPMIVAGYPDAVVEKLREVGVTDFVHVKTDTLQSLTRYHALFGIPETPLDEPLIPEQR